MFLAYPSPSPLPLERSTHSLLTPPDLDITGEFIMFTVFQDAVKAITRQITYDKEYDNDKNNLDVDEEFADQDRIFQEYSEESRRDRDSAPSLQVLFSGVREDAKGAHADRTRDTYKTYVPRF